MAYEFVKYEKKERIAYVTLNRPERMNALHVHAHNELTEIFDDFASDPEVWIAIITGAGDRAFSAGNDLVYQSERAAAGDSLEPLPPAGFAGITSRFDCYKPIIAAVNGYALGGGFETALACDIIIAADHAKFGLPEPRVGLMAGGGGIHRLPRQIPLKLAIGMLVTGRQITAQEAASAGVVNEVVPLADLMTTAEKWAAEILLCAPMSVRASKEGAMKSLRLPLDVAMADTALITTAMSAEDTIEGPKAFAEKRTPVWTGR